MPPSDLRAQLARDPVLAEIVRRLVDALHPDRIYLFGSRAQGVAGPLADFDFAVLSDFRPLLNTIDRTILAAL